MACGQNDPQNLLFRELLFSKTVNSVYLHYYLVLGGSITPNRKEEFTKGEDAVFSWTMSPASNHEMARLVLYNGTQDNTNELWTVGGNTDKANEMFNERMSVNHPFKGTFVTVTIKNVNFNDSITFLLIGLFYNNDNFVATPFQSAVTLHIKGKGFFFLLIPMYRNINLRI